MGRRRECLVRMGTPVSRLQDRCPDDIVDRGRAKGGEWGTSEARGGSLKVLWNLKDGEIGADYKDTQGLLIGSIDPVTFLPPFALLALKLTWHLEFTCPSYLPILAFLTPNTSPFLWVGNEAVDLSNPST